jgi:hypothetical protein
MASRCRLRRGRRTGNCRFWEDGGRVLWFNVLLDACWMDLKFCEVDCDQSPNLQPKHQIWRLIQRLHPVQLGSKPPKPAATSVAEFH